MDFSQLQYFLLFIGHGRSGHSLVGSFLDAHPQMLVSHELFILTQLNELRTPEMVYERIATLSQQQAETKRFKPASVYEYDIGASAGTSEELKVIGDKCGGNVSLQLRQRPWLLDTLREMIPLPFKFLHVVRNPFDNIATLSQRNGWALADTIDYYMRDEMAIERFMAQKNDVLTFRLEQLIATSESVLRWCCDFLEVSMPQTWTQRCIEYLFDEPNITRHAVEWTTTQIERIEKHIMNTDYLKGYTYGPITTDAPVSDTPTDAGE